MKITIKAKVTDDSRNKLGLIQSEYQNYQTYLQSRCKAEVNLYSATKQQAERQLREIQSDGELDVKKQYPVILRNDRQYTKGQQVRRCLLDQDTSISQIDQC